MKLVVLIPAYNEAVKIGEVIKKIPKTVLGIRTTVLVVDDGSKDQTSGISRKAGAIVIRHQTNSGVGVSFQTGLQKALEIGADYLVNIDADGQYTPKNIIDILKPIIDGEADFVTANRFKDKHGNPRVPVNMPKDKYYGNLMMSKLISFLAGQKFDDVSSGFRAYSKKAMLLLELTGKFTYTQESFIDLASKGISIKSVSVSIKYFKDRKSRVAGNLLKYGIRTLIIIVKTFRDYKPFLFFLYLSIIPACISVISAIFLTYWYIASGSFTPYKIVGFVFIYFSAFTFALLAMGFLADMFTRIRMYQEKILYYQKMRFFQMKENGYLPENKFR